MRAERWAIIGGGVLGMLLAHRAAQAGRQVVLFEAAGELGGLASVWQLGDVTWDRHYHVIVPSDSYLRAVLKELDLDDEIRFVQTKVGFHANGRLHSMSTAWEFLRFPPLSLWEKVRLGATIAVGSKLYTWDELDGVPAERWLRKWSGNGVTDRIWIPLLRSKLGELYTQTSAAFIWGSIRRMYAARQTGAKKETFGYVPGGYARILDRFRAHLIAQGVDIRLSHAATQVSPQPAGDVAVGFANGHRASFDRVILAMATPIAARLCPALSPDERDRMTSVKYLGIVCASVLLRRPLAGYYVTNLTDGGSPFTGVIEMTSIVDRATFGGHTLVYLPKYLSADDPELMWSDEQIAATYVAGLRAVYPSVSAEDVIDVKVSREKYVMAIPTLNYGRRLPPTQTTIPGVHLISSAHITTGTLAVNTTFELGERAIKEVLALPRRSGSLASSGS